jgi:outer membrane protein OmpA-like peptidoglycan-associated protein
MPEDMAAPEPAEGGEDTAGMQAPEEEPEETQTAARTTGELEQVRVSFVSGSAELSDEAEQALGALADRMKQDETLRIQLLAYAEGTEDTASRARRLSLSRALAVRSFLIDQGIRSTRMDVRALGSQSEDGPADRVDIVPAER